MRIILMTDGKEGNVDQLISGNSYYIIQVCINCPYSSRRKLEDPDKCVANGMHGINVTTSGSFNLRLRI